MKVSCQSCGAQYNLPDDKVRGRKAKVRCKKCGESIVVDGTAATASNPPGRLFEEEDEATRVMDSPIARSSALWTVNLSDEDQREMTTEELVSAWVAKEVTDDAYVWRDGMDEWLPILSAPDLVQALRIGDPTFESSPPVAASDEAARRPPPAGSNPEPTAPAPKVAERPRSEPKAAAVPVAPKVTPLATPAPVPVATKPQATVEAAKRPMVTAGLFGQIPDKGKPAANKQAARTPGAGGDLFGGTRAPSQPPKAAENSVMFSLDALKAAAAVEERGGRDRDVRVSEDLLVMGGPSGYDLNPAPLIQIDMPPPAAIPIAAPASLGGQAAKPAESPWLSTPVMVVAGLVVVVGAFFGVQAMTSSSKPTPDTNAVTAAGERKAADVTPEAPSAEPLGDSKPAVSAAQSAAAVAAAPSAPPANAGATPAVAAAPKPAGGGTPKPAGGGGGGATPKPAAEPAGGKGAFNVGAAKEALGSAASQAKLCKSGDGPTGSGKVQITFAPSGRVTVANVVGGPFAGTSVGGCVARAFRGARVPPFDGAPQTVSKGFSIN